MTITWSSLLLLCSTSLEAAKEGVVGEMAEDGYFGVVTMGEMCELWWAREGNIGVVGVATAWEEILSSEPDRVGPGLWLW